MMSVIADAKVIIQSIILLYSTQLLQMSSLTNFSEELPVDSKLATLFI